MGQHGADATMNENGELLTDLCEANEMVIGGSPNRGLPNRPCHNQQKAKELTSGCKSKARS